MFRPLHLGLTAGVTVPDRWQQIEQGSGVCKVHVGEVIKENSDLIYMLIAFLNLDTLKKRLCKHYFLLHF